MWQYSHTNNGYTKAPQCYVMRTLVTFLFESNKTLLWEINYWFFQTPIFPSPYKQGSHLKSTTTVLNQIWGSDRDANENVRLAGYGAMLFGVAVRKEMEIPISWTNWHFYSLTQGLGSAGERFYRWHNLFYRRYSKFYRRYSKFYSCYDKLCTWYDKLYAWMWYGVLNRRTSKIIKINSVF